ncbi:hypothetical protein Tco_1492734 [Tanacetum coccineum]
MEPKTKNIHAQVVPKTLEPEQHKYKKPQEQKCNFSSTSTSGPKSPKLRCIRRQAPNEDLEKLSKHRPKVSLTPAEIEEDLKFFAQIMDSTNMSSDTRQKKWFSKPSKATAFVATVTKKDLLELNDLYKQQQTGSGGLGEYSFGGACEKSATVLLTNGCVTPIGSIIVRDDYLLELLVISTNLDIQKNHYPLDFTNRRGDEARIKNTWYNQGLVNECHRRTLKILLRL